MKIVKRVGFLVIVCACAGLYSAFLGAVSVSINDGEPFECNDSIIDISAHGDLKRLKISQNDDDKKILIRLSFLLLQKIFIAFKCFH